MPWVKEERARLIVVETVRRIVAAEYDEVWGKPMLAARCRAVQLFEQVSPAMAKAQAVLPLECAKQALKGLRGCLHSDLRVGSPCAAAAQAAARSFRKRFCPGFDQRFERVRYRGCITARYEGLTLRENPGLGCRSRASGSSPRGNFAVSLPVSAKGRRRIAHQRAGFLPAAET